MTDAIRTQVAEEIATALESKAAWFRGHREFRTATGLVIGAGIAREIGTQSTPEDGEA